MGPPGGPGTFFANYAGVRATNASAFTEGYIAYVMGYNTAGDGGQGYFQYLPASVETDNDGTILTPSNNIGRWLRIYTGPVSARWFGAQGDDSTNDTSAAQGMLDYCLSVGKAPYFPAGTYQVTGLTVHGSNLSILGDGSTLTTLKMRASGSPAITSSVLELGEFDQGNAATPFTKLSVRGITLDGNKANVLQPTSDLTGWGLTLTAISNAFFDDVRCLNCWNGGFGNLINSNYNIGNIYVENCGEGFTGPTTREPGFDINSSKYCHFSVTSVDCYNGARILDNCWGNILDLVVLDAVQTGFIYTNQTTNNSRDNQVRVTVDGGCSAQGVLVSFNCRNSIIDATIQNVDGIGFNEVGGLGANIQQSNTYRVSTRQCGFNSCVIGGAQGVWTISSFEDGQAGAQGDYFAVDVVSGAILNQITLNLKDQTPWHIRGIHFNSGADNNQVASYDYNNRTTGQPYLDDGSGNQIFSRAGLGLDVASGTSITIPLLGALFNITGTTGITTINSSSVSIFTLKFTASLTVQDNTGNLKLNGDFVATADDTLTLYFDGTNCFEISRSAN